MDDLKSDALRDMDVEIRLDATRRKPRFIIETAEMTPELTRLIQQLTARAAVPIIGYQQDKARSSRIPSSASGRRTGMSTPRRKQASFSSANGSGNSKNASIRTTSSASATAKSSTSAA